MQAAATVFYNKYIKKIVFLLTILSFIATLSFIVRSYYLHRTLVPRYEQKLDKKLNAQVARINAFLDEIKDKANGLAADPVILDYLEKGTRVDSISPTEQQTLSNFLAKRQENLGFKSVSLIANNSTVVFSTNPLLRNVHLNDEKYSATPLFKSHFVSSMTLTPDFSDFLYSTTIKAPAFYITMPLIRNNKVLGELAYQIDEEKINAITRDYLDLGATGETALTALSGPYAVFIVPTRNDPSIRFTRKELFVESSFKPMQRAAEGETGSGVDIDYRNQKVVASWSFIPRVDWAIVVKIDLVEVLQPIVSANEYLIAFLILTLLFAAFTAFLYWQTIGKRLSVIRTVVRYIPAPLRHPEFTFILIFLFLSALSIYQYNYSISSALKKSQDLAIKKVKDGISKIDAELEKIRLLADFIAQDLRTERLISEDIRKRLRREIVETDGLVRITIAYGPNKYSNKIKLYAPSITREENGTLIEQQIGELYDYTSKNEGLSATRWYTQAMESQKPDWQNPSKEPLSTDRVVTYATPFYFYGQEKVPAGVIAISYKLPIFTEIAQNMGIGETGYAFIVSQDQTFLYHPTLANVFKKKTLLEFAQEEGDNDLEHIAQKISAGKPILEEISSGTTQNTSWIYTQPVGIAGWTVASVFPSSEIGLPLSVIKDNIFNIIIFLSISILLILDTLCRFYSRKPLFNFLILSNFILTIAIICLWYVVDTTSRSDNKTSVLITDQASINRFIHRQVQEANRKNEPIPIAIPCGLELYSLQQSSPKDVSFSGYIWHRYHKTQHKDIQRIIRIPQATAFRILNQNIVSEGDWETVELNVTATIYHEIDYSFYPFEKHQIVIPLEHADIGKHILLVPDLEGYTSINPYRRPGLDTTFSATKFYSTETFFNYTPYKPKSDFGVRKYFELTGHYRLAF